MIVTLDANILVYSVDHRDLKKHEACKSLLAALVASGGPLGLQVCGEFYNAVTRRLHHAPWVAAQGARNFITAFPIFGSNSSTFQTALAEAATGRLSFWDANLLAAAEAAGCTHMISEDMHDGARLGRIEVVAAFAPDGGVSDRARTLLQIDKA